MLAPQSTVLVGLMGSGKTTAGEEAARRLGWQFVDSDRVVEERAGRSVADLWAAEGEPRFRDLEAAVLADVLATAAERPVVVAAGGGAVLRDINRELLRRHPPVVWLRARPDTLARRCGSGDGRPLLATDPAGTLARLAAERERFYADVATEVVDVDDLVPAEVVERVVAIASRQPA